MKAVLRLLIACGVLVASAPGPVSATTFARDGWGWWLDGGDAASRGRGGTSLATTGYGAAMSLNPAAIAGTDLSYGFASYSGEVYDVRGEEGSFRQRKDLLPHFGGAVVLPRGLVIGGRLRTQTDAAYERTESFGDGGAGTYELRTKGIGGWERVQLELAGPAMDDRLLWGVSLGYVLGTVKEDSRYVFASGEGRTIRMTVEGRMRGAWIAGGGAIFRPTPRVAVGASGSLGGSSSLIQETRVLEGASAGASTRGRQEVPAQWGFGFRAMPTARIALTGDLVRTLWGEAATRPATGEASVRPYHDATRWGVGIELTPAEADAQRPRWIARAGYSEAAFYVRTVDGETVLERALCLGMRTSAGRNRAALDFALEMGRRGDRDRSGIEEGFVRLTLGVSYSSAPREY